MLRKNQEVFVKMGVQMFGGKPFVVSFRAKVVTSGALFCHVKDREGNRIMVPAYRVFATVEAMNADTTPDDGEDEIIEMEDDE
jgi:hypothetical protein